MPTSNGAGQPQRFIGILGGRAINVHDDDALVFAHAVGAGLARNGFGIVTGGDDGIGAAACRGCHEAGGLTVAVLKESHADRCSPYVSVPIPTSFDLARSVVLNWAACAFIAFDGAYGTLFEIALALDTQRPLVITGNPRFLRLEEVREPNCRIMPGNSLDQVAGVLAAVNELTAAGEQPAEV